MKSKKRVKGLEGIKDQTVDDIIYFFIEAYKIKDDTKLLTFGELRAMFLNSTKTSLAIDKMIALDILNEDKNNSDNQTYYKLGKLGHEIINLGDYDTYLEHEIAKKSLTIKQNKWFIVSAATAILAVVITTIIGVCNTNNTKQTDRRLDTLENKIQLIENHLMFDKQNIQTVNKDTPSNKKSR